jgi:hypothetical protein
MKRLIFVLCLLGIAATTAVADVPDESNCQTSLDGLVLPRLLLIPDLPTPATAGAFTVTVRNASGLAINNAVVVIEIGGIVDNKVALCQSAITTRNTNASGVVSFNIPGGGCYKGAGAFTIRANGVAIRSFTSVESPDYSAFDNAGIAGRWSKSITAADFSAFGQAWQNGTGPASCHDYDGNNAMNAGDFSIFGAVWSNGTRNCP